MQPPDFLFSNGMRYYPSHIFLLPLAAADRLAGGGMASVRLIALGSGVLLFLASLALAVEATRERPRALLPAAVLLATSLWLLTQARWACDARPHVGGRDGRRRGRPESLEALLARVGDRVRSPVRARGGGIHLGTPRSRAAGGRLRRRLGLRDIASRAAWRSSRFSRSSSSSRPSRSRTRGSRSA